ncbi:MAG: DNA mismatch repair endonuclease MutL [Nitrospiraceae bacterium]|nr:MAG: DNA mismatch repair endonuclease MutL [Nitrospiraceae bacterium]
MSKIAVLPDILINKIAAGEVIERPASIVRELIDNSIDAGSTKIDIDILHGGKKLIKVSDNGCGMDRDDAMLCLERHATSKIKSEDDLFDISTLGFRGEALPAIASVSKITLSTSAVNSDAGTRIEIGVNQKKDVTAGPPLQGTTIEVRDIFYNTPARRKFLKSTPTELSHIIETVVQKAFAYPGISFSLSHNGGDILNVPVASNLKERLIQLYSGELAAEFLEIEKGARGIKVYGFASAPDFARARRSHQYIFVNKRPVKNSTISHAIYTAYAGLVPKDRHPAYFLFVDIDSGKVDVNVHPAKREVRFESPDEIHRLAGEAIHAALNPGHDTETARGPAPDTAFNTRRYTEYPSRDNPVVCESALGMFDPSQTDFFTSGVTQDVRRFFHLGESFFATVTDDGLLIVDQHAAHERILYEKFLRKTTIESEALFLPLRAEMPVREYHLIIRHKELLHGFGIDLDDFGGNNVIVRSLPKGLPKTDIKGLLMDIAAGIVEEETSGVRDGLAGGLLENIAARIACHKSVRGSEPLNNEELTGLMSDLDKTGAPGRCPHGRPTRILLSLDDLAKMFKRK